MWPVASDVTYSVVCICLFVLGTQMIRAKMAEPIEVLFGGWTHVGPRNLVLYGVQILQ